MKLLVVTESKAVWGAEESLLRLLSTSGAHGVSATVAVPRDSPLTPRLRELGIDVHATRFARLPALRGTGSWGTASWRARCATLLAIAYAGIRHSRTFRQFDAVVIFSIWQGPESLLAAKLMRRPVLLDLHETFATPAGSRLAASIARRCKGVLSPSAYLLSRTGLSESPTAAVIPRPVDIHGYAPPVGRAEPAGVVTVGMFGQVAEHKGVHHLCSAAKASGDRVRVLIVGGESNRDRRTEYETGIRDRVEAELPQASVIDRVADPRELMAQCDYIVNCSQHEAFGRGVLESISVGSIPVVLKDSGPAEIVSTTGVGVILDSVDDLTDWLRHAEVAPLNPQTSFDVEEYSSEAIGRRYWNTVKRLAGTGRP